MTKKRRDLFASFEFDTVNPYGTGNAVDTRPITLDDIRPDPDQPRHLLPRDLATRLVAGRLTPVQVIEEWRERAQVDQSATAKAFAGVSQLAESIEQHGLINPITIRAVDDGQFLIVTGERRYWAHVLLSVDGRLVAAAASPHEIAASVVGENVPILVHQIIENLQRYDLSSLEKARGLMALRQQLAADDKPASWATVERAVGISRAHRSRLTSMLNLSEQAVAIVEEWGLSERVLRPVINQLDTQDDQTAVLEEVAALLAADPETELTHHDTQTMVNRLLSSRAVRPQASATPTGERPALTVRQIRTGLKGAFKVVAGKVPDEVRRQIESDEALRHDLIELRRWLDQLVA